MPIIVFMTNDSLPTHSPGKTPRIQRIPPDHAGVLIAALIMAGGGGWGLYQLVTTRLPRIDAIWLFFVLLLMTVTGVAIPFVRFLNLRFAPSYAPTPPGGVIVRQSVWIGLYVVTCAWLQIPRVLSLPIAFFLALVFVVLEIFLRSRELARERE